MLGGAPPEILTEQIEYKTGEDTYEVKEYKYVYDANYEKYYYEEAKNKFFYLSNKEKNYLIDATLENCKYKKLSLYQEDDTIKTVYQPLNVPSDTSWYDANKNDITEQIGDEQIEGGTLGIRYYDYSATNYYIESFAFNKWVTDTFPDNFLSIDKIQAMKDSINNNLNEAISRYGKDFYLPKLTEEEWEQVFSNLSIITFFQGVPAGLKTYNNYSIATSTSNREFISENGLYYMGSDNFYHKAYCSKMQSSGNIKGYRSIEFNYSKNKEDATKYYLHGNEKLACYDCIVNTNKYKKLETLNNMYSAENTAIARERYIQMQRTKLVPDAEEEPVIPDPTPNPDPTPEEPTPHTHVPIYTNDNEEHWQICADTECNVIISEKEMHIFSRYMPIYASINGRVSTSSIQHKKICETCGYEYEEAHTWGTYTITNTRHSRSCLYCGVTEMANHQYNSETNLCICGRNKSGNITY